MKNLVLIDGLFYGQQGEKRHTCVKVWPSVEIKPKSSSLSLQDLKVKPFPPVFQGQLTLGNSFHRLKTEQTSSLIA